MISREKKVYVAGHKGLVGTAILRRLQKENFKNIITRTHDELDLTRQESVEKFFEQERPDFVFLSAAKVGGIMANSKFPADFYYINSMINNNIIFCSYKYGVEKLLFLGSSCIYPKNANQPICEEELLQSSLEQTNEAYALAKIGGLKLCDYFRRQYGCNFISAMPTNVYGKNDNFNLETSHFLPALIRKFHEAKLNNYDSVVIWGSGKPKRELIYNKDLSHALLFLMDNYNEEGHINIGTGIDYSILEIAFMIKEIVGFKGKIINDLSKPDGTLRKLLCINKLRKMGWTPKTNLTAGIEKVYKWYKENYENLGRA